MSQKKSSEETTNNTDLKVSFTPNQQLWYQTPATEVLIGGSFGSGKSFFLRWASILWAMEIPGINIFLFRRTFPDLRINHLVGPQSYLSILEPLISGGWVKYNSAHNTFKFWNGSIITLSHLQQEADMYRWQGSEIHCLLLDEGTTFTEAQYKFMRSRVRMSGVKVPEKWKGHFPRIVVSSNPGGISHNFFKMGFVDLCPNNRIVKMPDDEGGLLRQYLPAKLIDNPYLMKEDPDYVKRIMGMGNTELVTAMLEGDWNIPSGQMFSDVMDSVKCLVGDFRLPEHWTLRRGFDYGYSAPFSVLWYAIADDTPCTIDGKQKTFKPGTIVIVDELYGSKPNKPAEGIRWSPGDIARAIKEQERHYDRPVRPGPADNSIYDGDSKIAEEMAVHGVEWCRSNKAPGSRKIGWQQIRQKFNAMLPETQEEPGLVITNKCQMLWRNLTGLPRDTNNLDDVDTKAIDHDADTLRYIVLDKPKTAKMIPLQGY